MEKAQRWWPTLDKFDAKIINILVSGDEGEISSYDVAKKMFGDLKKHDLKLKDNFVRSRLKRLDRIGILYSVKTHNKRNYFLSKNCRVIRGKMQIGQKTISGVDTFVIIKIGGMRLIIA